MGLTSLQVCMDTSDWFQQNGVQEEGASGSSSPPSGEMIECSTRPGMATERRMRPPHEQALKCPRCDSTHTKFCYYNNYSLSQPRYFCKTCRRYWTKGGTLRNVPVGGGCRKNKKVSSSSKKGTLITPPDHPPHSLSPSSMISPITSTDLHLSPFSHGIPSFTSFNSYLDNSDAMECKYAAGDSMSMLGDHMINSLNDSKLDLMMGSSVSSSPTGYYYSNRINADESFGGIHGSGSCNIPFGFTMEPVGSEVYHHESFPSVHNGSGQRLMQLESIGGALDHHANSTVEIKPSSSLLALEWHGHDHQANSYAGFGKDPMSFNPMNGIAAWPGMMNIDGA